MAVVDTNVIDFRYDVFYFRAYNFFLFVIETSFVFAVSIYEIVDIVLCDVRTGGERTNQIKGSPTWGCEDNGEMGSVGVLFVGTKACEVWPFTFLLVGRTRWTAVTTATAAAAASSATAATARTAYCAARRGRLHQLLVRNVSVLVQENVKRFLVDTSLRKFNLGKIEPSSFMILGDLRFSNLSTNLRTYWETELNFFVHT